MGVTVTSGQGSDTITERLERCWTGIVHDVMRKRDLTDFVLPREITALIPDRPLCGPIWTVTGTHVETGGGETHATLQDWAGFLRSAPDGHVVVCAANGAPNAQIGELTAEALMMRGVRGFVTDGGCRDSRILLRIGFQVFSGFFTPRDLVGCWRPERAGAPIEIGGVTIATGDYLLGDRDGVLIIPGREIDAVVAAAEQAIIAENLVRKAILDGEDPEQAYIKFGQI